ASARLDRGGGDTGREPGLHRYAVHEWGHGHEVEEAPAQDDVQDPAHAARPWQLKRYLHFWIDTQVASHMSTLPRLTGHFWIDTQVASHMSTLPRLSEACSTMSHVMTQTAIRHSSVSRYWLLEREHG